MRWNFGKTAGLILIFYITMAKFGITFETDETILLGLSFGLITMEVGNETKI